MRAHRSIISYPCSHGRGEVTTNMADGKGKKRGRYKEYMRHSNPYKFPAARRQKVGKRYLHKKDPSLTAIQQSYSRDHDCEFEDDVDLTLCYEPDVTSDTSSSLNDEEFCNYEQDVLDMGCEEFIEERQCDSTNFKESTYARFIKDDDASSDVFSDNEHIESDTESLQEECETENDDVLYPGAPITTTSSIVLILSFVLKYNLTHEAFRDLLAVIEAHCPRPNNCKTKVKKLFDFVSEAKGNIVKHFFCSYCKAYSGKGTQTSHGTTEVKGTCYICGKNLAKTNGFYIEVPISKQLQKFFTGKCILILTSDDDHQKVNQLELQCSSKVLNISCFASERYFVCLNVNNNAYM